MATVGGSSQQIPNYNSLNDTQKKDVENINAAAAKLDKAALANDKKAFKEAKKELSGAFKQAEKDQISKSDLKVLGKELKQDGISKQLVAEKSAGRPIDDHGTANRLVNDFQRFCKMNGLDSKKAESFEKWKGDITPNLKQAGLAEEDINKVLAKVAEIKDKPGLDMKKRLNMRA